MLHRNILPWTTGRGTFGASKAHYFRLFERSRRHSTETWINPRRSVGGHCVSFVTSAGNQKLVALFVSEYGWGHEDRLAAPCADCCLTAREWTSQPASRMKPSSVLESNQARCS